jgi:NAD(P)-dependent dehydrogenase (short-subunit alcohol dehydrogenase family)
VLGPVWLADPQQWWQAVAVDLRGTMLTAQCAITRMLAVGGGRLVTIYGNLGDRQQGYVSGTPGCCLQAPASSPRSRGPRLSSAPARRERALAAAGLDLITGIGANAVRADR